MGAAGLQHAPHNGNYMMARGQPIVPGAPLQTLFQQGLEENAPWLPEPTPASEVDVMVPLDTRMCRFGIHVSVLAKLALCCL